MTEQSAFSLAEAAGVFRPVHYLGCKLRVLDVLDDVVQDLDPRRGRLLDLFSGTGVVAAHFAQSRSVMAADVQEYARVLAHALLVPAALSSHQVRGVFDSQSERRWHLEGPGLAALVSHERSCMDSVQRKPDALSALVEEGSLLRYQVEGNVRSQRLAGLLAGAAAQLPAGPETVLTRHYGGVYFGYEQAIVLDGLATAVRQLPSPLREVGLAAVMSTASDIVSSVGNQFAQPLRPRDRAGQAKVGALRNLVKRRRLSARELFAGWLSRYMALPPAPYSVEARRGDFRDVLRDTSDDLALVYADPPYTRDHYSRYYHVLETIALGDEPGVASMRLGNETRISRGLYRVDRHQSPFSIKSQAPAAFEVLFSGTRDLGVPLVLSYSPHGEGSASRPRLMGIDDLVQIAREFYDDVDVVSAGRLAHSKLNAARLNADQVFDAELLIVCRAN